MTSGSTVHQARRVRRTRATRQQITDRRAALHAIAAAQKPMTVRQVFYQATVRGLIEKSEAGYDKVQVALADMRRSGELPYDWIADNTRWVRKPRTYAGPNEALRETVAFYRRDLWIDADAHVEIWLEKDALAGVVSPVTSRYDVPLMVARGYSSLSFLHEVSQTIASIGVPAHLYHLGDFDPSGVNAAEKIEQTLRRLAPHASISFERIAVTEAQISAWNLPSRPTKASDSRAKRFGAVSVELDAIPPDRLRGLVAEAIARHMPPERLAALTSIEQHERRILTDLIAGIEDG